MECLEWQVDGIKDTIELQINQGTDMIDRTPKIGAHGNPVAFAHPKSFSGTLIEFEET